MNQLEKKRLKYSKNYKKIIIVGHPNVGKSTIFRRLCKNNVVIYSYPNTSIEIGVGWFTEDDKTFEVIDTPGGNSIYSNSEDDKIIREILLGEDEKIILHVTDTRNIKRTLLYTIELCEFKAPLILDFNMADEMRARGISVDYQKIFEIFGIRAVQTIADEGEGIEQLKKEILKFTIPEFQIRYSGNLERTIGEIANIFKGDEDFSRIHTLLYLTMPESIERIFKSKFSKDSIEKAKSILKKMSDKLNSPIDIELIKIRAMKALQIENRIVKYSEPYKIKYIEKIEKWMRIPITGIPIFLFILFIFYLFVGVFGAGVLADFIQYEVFGKYIVYYSDLLLKHIDFRFLQEALTGKYGIISFALTLCLGVVLPIVSTFFFALALVEDSNYLPRLSILFDQTLKKIGISGRAIMPIVLGFSCITMAVLSTRILETKKERLITAIILILGIPCSAQSSILLAVIATISLKALFIIFIVVSIQIILAGFLLNKFIPGEKSSFIMEILPLRIPEIKNVLYKTKLRVMVFMREVFPLFMLAGFIMFILDKIRVLELIEMFGAPIIKNFWGLPIESTDALILGFARKEAGAAVIKSLVDSNLLSEIQTIIIVIVTLLFVPCFSTFLVLIKEYGIRDSLIMAIGVFIIAILTGGILNNVLRFIY
ncbi:MAG: ferrous iron transport protein B [Candidatus Helarchaeota archaeon]|nr:ferrous iron transport protein B [Candidatus Helarchaeota archaeon]